MKVVILNLSSLAIHYWLGNLISAGHRNRTGFRAVTNPEPGKKRCFTLFLRISSIIFACLVPFKYHCFYSNI